MSDQSFVLYDPTAEPRAIAAGLAARLAGLQGMRVGMLDNSKANAGTPTFGNGTGTTRRVITRKDGTPLLSVAELRR